MKLRINFGKLPETPAKTISLQNLQFSGHIETINIKKASLPLVEVSFQSCQHRASKQVSLQVINMTVNSLSQFSTFLTGR